MVLAAGSAFGDDVAAPLLAGSEGAGVRSTDVDGGTWVAETLRSHPRPGSNSSGALVVADTLTAGSHPGSNMPGRRREDDANLAVFHATQDPISSPHTSPSLGGSPKAGASVGVSSQQAVRRLTPLECERLMGWPQVFEMEGASDADCRAAVRECRAEARAAGWDADELRALWRYGEAGSPPSGHRERAGDDDSALSFVSCGRARPAGGLGAGAGADRDVHRVRFDVQPAAASALAHLLGPGVSSGDGTPIGAGAVECRAFLTGWTAPLGMTAPDSRRYAACGDGVVAPVAEWIMRGIMRQHLELAGVDVPCWNCGRVHRVSPGAASFVCDGETTSSWNGKRYPCKARIFPSHLEAEG